MSTEISNRAALDTFEEQIVDAVNTDEAWDLLERFADLERVTGTEDERLAAEYIIDRLEANDISYERYDPELYISQPIDATLRDLDRGFEAGPIKTVAFSATATVQAPVTYVGTAEASDVGSEATDSEQYHAQSIDQPYRDVDDLSGQIALTAAGSLSIRAARILEDAGAEGVIAIHEHEREPHSGIATSVWGGAPPLDEKDRIPGIPIVNVRKLDGEKLKTWAQSEDGLEVELSTETNTGWMECPIVVAEIEAGSAQTEDFALLHAHYDSWAVGITDNATGDAGLLELARVFNEHRDGLTRNLRVAWWPGHSTGRYAGSTWYVDEFAHDLVDHCIAHVNMDSPGAKGSREYVDMACWMPDAHETVAGAIEDVTGAPYEENRPRRAGDYSFNNLGLTGCFTLSSNIPGEVRELMDWHPVGGCGGNADAWHVSTDTIDKAGDMELLRDIRMYSVLLTRLLTAEVIPLNHVRNVQRHQEIVSGYDELIGDAFDFGPTLAALDDLETDLEAFYDAVEAGEVDPTVANDVIKRVGRTLTRLNFTSEGQFEQDPAHSRPAYPRFGVASRLAELDENTDDYRFCQVQLKRAQNEVVYELRRAREQLPA
ncbi:MAG: M28 family peptidase [Halobacteriales archaeon]|nr:M28 family peptidase [Halobacteriales archaeon]